LLLAYYLGIHIDLFQRIAIAPASVSILALGKDGAVRVMRMNDTGPIKLPKLEEKEGEKEHEEIK
jgi:probable phosphoglycerate mutase